MCVELLHTILNFKEDVIYYDLISLKYQTKDTCDKCRGKVMAQMAENKEIVTQNINKQYREIIEKIEHQTEIFQSLAKSVAEISAENKIILQNLGLKK